jgi:selenocysteine-specific elongation factor
MRSQDGVVSATLILDDPLVARSGDRFVIRLPSPARTVGGGVVIDPYPRTEGRQRARRARLPDRGIDSLLAHVGIAGVTTRTIPLRTGLGPNDVQRDLKKLGAIVTATRAFAQSAVQELEQKIQEVIALGIANHPLEAGVSLQTVRTTIDAPSEVMDVALARLEKRKEIEIVGSLVRPFGWVSNLGQREQALSDAILHEICTHGSEPPSVAELASKFGGETQAMLRRLERQGLLERVSDDRYYGSQAVAEMIEALRSGLEAGRVYPPGELRGVLGVSRKYLIPFLEFCDRNGVTERRENGRLVRQGSRTGVQGG